MKLLDFHLLTDEDIVPDVVLGLRVRGCDVRSASDDICSVGPMQTSSNTPQVSTG